MNVQETAKNIKEIVALGEHYIEDLNLALADCNISVTYNSARRDMEEHFNNPVEQIAELIGSLK
tara:strand:+ start:251 stop:442 length:192 start_codon:yes stop_codon:yes gene_type:complete